MARPRFRLLVTEPASAAWNMALDAVLLEGRAAGTSPPTIRFLAFSPKAALVGAHQSVDQEIRVEHCRAHGIEISRRLTGGGAILFDESQVGWEVVCRFDDLGLPRRPSEELFVALSSPVVHALRSLGLDAAYRPRNDIEVGGRKICGTGGTELRGALLFQGTLLVDFDIEAMVRALRVPVEKLRRHEIDGMRDRVTWLARELAPRPAPARAEIHAMLARSFAEVLAIDLEPAGLSAEEQGSLARAVPRYAGQDWVLGRGRPGGALLKAAVPTEGGVVRVLVRTGADPHRITAATIDGDFFVFPRTALYDLEARLKSVAARDVATVVERFFAEVEVEVPGVGAAGITAALLEAFDRQQAAALGLGPAEWNAVFPIGVTLAALPSLEPTHLLLPYCAKPIDCELRKFDGCALCGRCTVGQAYARGAEAGLEVTTVTSFEHLMHTLRSLSGPRDAAFVGVCCEAFYIKHRREMEAAGVPGVLLDVVGSETCYDLGKASHAYRGEYEGETGVDLDLLEAVLGACGPARTPRSHGRAKDIGAC